MSLDFYDEESIKETMWRTDRDDDGGKRRADWAQCFLKFFLRQNSKRKKLQFSFFRQHFDIKNQVFFRLSQILKKTLIGSMGWRGRIGSRKLSMNYLTPITIFPSHLIYIRISGAKLNNLRFYWWKILLSSVKSITKKKSVRYKKLVITVRYWIGKHSFIM